MRPSAATAAVVCLITLSVSPTLASKHKKSYDGDFLFEEDDWKQKKEKPAVKTWIWDPENELCSALECRSSEMCLLEDSFTAVCVSRPELKTNGDRIISRQLAEDEHLIKSEPWMSEEDVDDDDDDEDEDEINLDEDDEYEYDDDDEEEKYDDKTEDDLVAKGDNDDDDEDNVVQNEKETEKECRECPYTHQSVSTYLCGTDNRTYSSLCRLEQHNCVHDDVVITNCKGFCPCRVSGSYRRHKDLQRTKLSQPESRYKSKKMNKSKLKSKYDKYHEEKKAFNNVKYYPKNDYKESKYHAKCSSEQLTDMGTRLVDWFAVLKKDNAAQPRPKHNKYYGTHFPSGCRSVSRWMFLYLDSDSDSQLTQRELYKVERDPHERCLKSFLDRCDLNGDIFVSPREWCRCFEDVKKPCHQRRSQTKNKLGSYVPSCDADGFYRPTQCQGSQCWCADRYGMEKQDTRARRGSTRCDGDMAQLEADFNVADEDDEDNYVIDGSGDGLQEF